MSSLDVDETAANHNGDEDINDVEYDDDSSSSSSSDDSMPINYHPGPPRLSYFSITEDEPTLKQHEQDRDDIINGRDPFRYYLYSIVESRLFSFGILTVILLNTVSIGVATSKYIVAKSEWYLILLENFFLAVYLVELAMKMYIWRLKFFQSSWNIFDFVIVLVSLMDFVILSIAQMGNFNGQVFQFFLRLFHAVRAIRALRVIRTIRFLKQLQIIVTAVLKSIPAMGSIIVLISLVLYVFAIIGRGLYGEVAPDRFGNLAKACFTLFQLITLDDWFYMYSDIRDNYPNHQHILVYLILFIILETFIFINLFVAVIVDNFARTQAAANASVLKNKALPAHTTGGMHDIDSELELGKAKAKDSANSTEPFHTEIESFYPADQYSEMERKLLSQHWQAMASLEHQLKLNNDRQRTLNELVDLIDLNEQPYLQKLILNYI